MVEIVWHLRGDPRRCQITGANIGLTRWRGVAAGTEGGYCIGSILKKYQQEKAFYRRNDVEAYRSWVVQRLKLTFFMPEE